MRIANLIKASALATTTALLFACGGGDEGVKETTVSGVAQAGTFSSGKAVFKGYSGANKNKEYTLTKADGTPIVANFVAADKGRFSANIGTYAGPLKIGVSGTYTDEATDLPVVVPESAPIKAIIPATAVSSGAAVPVTPLTEISANKIDAVIKTSAAPNDVISQNNKGVAQLFGLTDVTATVPVAPTLADLNATTTTASQTAYTVALVKLSQYVAAYVASTTGLTTETAFSGAMSQISSGINIVAGTTATSAPVVTMNDAVVSTALATAIAAPITIPTSSTDATAAALPASAVTAASTILTKVNTAAESLTVQKYNVQIAAASAVSIHGATIEITLPAGVSLSLDEKNATTVGTVKSDLSSGVIVGHVSGGVLKLAFISGTAVGLTTANLQLATILSTVTATAPSPLSVVSVIAKDNDGNVVSGVTATVTAAP